VEGIAHKPPASSKAIYDLVAIGGGPAGAAAAIVAARNGARVLLLERGRYPRHKVCGEFVSAESLELLSTFLRAAPGNGMPDATRIPRARIFVDGHVIAGQVEPPAASIARLDLDGALWQAAQKAGAETRQQTPVLSIEGEGPFRISTPAHSFASRSVVHASGRWSNLTAPHKNGNSTDRWLGLKAHFVEEQPPCSVDLYFFEGGYCGVQPVALRADGAQDNHHGRINVCAMVRAKVAANLTEVFGRHPALSDRSHCWRQVTDTVTTAPLIFRDPEPVRGHILLAGDAAGFVDPFVGDGISLALRSGALAAETLLPFLRGEITLAQAAASYRQRYERKLLPIFRAASAIRRLLSLPAPLRLPLAKLLESAPRLTDYLVRKTR
jgi:flavin-dependent dehydrogenase